MTTLEFTADQWVALQQAMGVIQAFGDHHGKNPLSQQAS
jgi:hypothetical protein